MRIQWKPNLIREQSRVCLTRLRNESGQVGDGKGYSWMLSLSLCWAWRDVWIGAYIKPESNGWIVYLCVLPCLPIRLHYQRSYGGIYP